MNKYINHFKIAVAAATLFTITSCKKDFLDETLKTARSTDFFKTDAGIQQLAVGTYYQVFNVPVNGEWFYCATNYGTDEFRIGGDPSNSPWNNYDQTFNSVVTVVNSNTAAANFQWDALYTGIGDANLLIQNATNSTSTSTAIKNTALGEGYFMRAYSYLRLVSQYGGVPLQLVLTLPRPKICCLLREILLVSPRMRLLISWQRLICQEPVKSTAPGTLHLLPVTWLLPCHFVIR